MRIKKVLSVLLVLALVSAVFCACGGNSQNENINNPDENVNKTIAVIAKGESHAFWQSVKNGAEDAAKKYGYKITFRGPVSENSSEIPSQKEMAQTALSNNVSGIVIATIGEGFTDVLEQAYDKKIPVVEFDSGLWEADKNALEEIRKNPVVSSVATSNITAAELAAENFFEKIKADIKEFDGVYVVGVIQHDRTQTGVERTKGFVDKFKELADEDDDTNGKYRIEKEIKDGDGNNAYVDALNALVEKKVNAIFMSNEGVVKQVSDALAANKGKYDHIKFCGFDAGTKQIEWMKSETGAVLVGSVAQDSYKIGFEAVEQCVFAIEEKTVARNVPVAGKWYSKENIDKLIKEKLVYEG